MTELLPRDAHELIAREPDALFVDCRSDIEFFFVGHPVGTIHVAWQDAPDWIANPHFVAEVDQLAGGDRSRPVVLICRSGNRSADAARALEQAGFARVYNVRHGFEGDLNERHHRGEINGWRHDGLPWEQS